MCTAAYDFSLIDPSAYGGFGSIIHICTKGLKERTRGSSIMRKINIISVAAGLSMLLGSAAFADDRTTGSATLVSPTTQAYVGTLVQSCQGISAKGGYLGVYLGQSFQVQGHASLGISTKDGTAFSTSPRANGEEGWVTEVGGQNRLACLPIGSKVFLLYSPLGPSGPIMLLGTGTVKSI
jgi:hypothetical protein